jgi:dephospho-CoA kinase
LGEYINSRIPRKVAVTGEIASGKTTACQLFKELGAYVVYTDEIVHQLLLPTTHLGKEIIAILGVDIVVDGKISREKVSQKVFSSPHLLKGLEALIHPEVRKAIEINYVQASQHAAPLFVVEIPLLFEAHMECDFDIIIVITCGETTCKTRSPLSLPDYERRSERLLSIEQKIKRADLVISNDGNLDDLRQQIYLTYHSLKEHI